MMKDAKREKPRTGSGIIYLNPGPSCLLLFVKA